MPFSFLNTAILAGLAAAALPILIHLFSRRKISKIPFSSIQFLEQISRRKIKRLRMTQWIILALRTLAVALLALALSRPAIKGDSPLGSGRGESAVAIVLDGSMSMQTLGTRQTLWETAVARARDVLDVLEDSDRVFIVGTDPGSGEVEAFPDPAAAWEHIRGREAGYAATDLAGAVSRAGQTLAQASAINKELFVISDFQRAGLSEEDAMGLNLDPEVRVFLLPVVDEDLPNTALSAGQIAAEDVNPTASAVLTRYGAIPAEDLLVTVEAPGEVLAEQRVTVMPQEPVSVELDLKRVPAGDEELSVHIPRDRLEADDVYYVSAQGMGRRNTLLVQEPASPSPYLPLALSPRKQGRYAVRVVAPAELQSLDFSAYNVVVLENVTSLGRGTLNRLRRWHQAGGVVMMVLGDRVDLRYYNQDLLPALMPGVRLGNVRRVDEATGASYALIPRAQGYPGFRGFDAKVDEPITGAAFWQIVEVQTSGDVRTLAEFGPGLPALVEGRGSLLLATSTDNKWNNLPTHAAFLPLVHQTLETISEKQTGGVVFVGEPITQVVDRSTLGTEELICEGPQGTFLKVDTQPDARGVQLRTEPSRLPGFYTIRTGGHVVVRRAVNPNPRESDLAVLSPRELDSWFPGDHVKRLPLSAELRVPVREARYGREFWKELVAVVLLLLIVEGWLSRRGVA